MTVVKKAITKSLARTQATAAKKKKPAKKAAKKRKKKKAKKAKYGVGGARRKGQHKSKASKAGGKRAAAAAEEEGRRPLQAGVVLGCPLGGHGHQGQVDPRPDLQGAVGAHQEEGPEQGPQRRQDRRDLRRRLDVQAPGRREQAHQVSECVFLSPVISTPGNRGC